MAHTQVPQCLEVKPSLCIHLHLLHNLFYCSVCIHQVRVPIGHVVKQVNVSAHSFNLGSNLESLGLDSGQFQNMRLPCVQGLDQLESAFFNTRRELHHLVDDSDLMHQRLSTNKNVILGLESFLANQKFWSIIEKLTAITKNTFNILLKQDDRLPRYIFPSSILLKMPLKKMNTFFPKKFFIYFFSKFKIILKFLQKHFIIKLEKTFY